MIINPDKLPFTVDISKWGVAVEAEACCPGVYHLETSHKDHAAFLDLYAIPKDYAGTVISKEALSYGTESNGALFFPEEEDESCQTGYRVIDFELQRNAAKAGDQKAAEDLYSAAMYGALYYPEYFGCIAPPKYTPYGLTVRAKEVVRGVYFVETEQSRRLLSLIMPIWDPLLLFKRTWGILPAGRRF